MRYIYANILSVMFVLYHHPCSESTDTLSSFLCYFGPCMRVARLHNQALEEAAPSGAHSGA